MIATDDEKTTRESRKLRSRFLALRLDFDHRRRQTAFIVAHGERIGEVSYSRSRLVDGIACLLAVISFFLPWVFIVAFFDQLPRGMQIFLDPLQPQGAPLWLWGFATITFATLAYLFSLLVVSWFRSRQKIQAKSLDTGGSPGIDIIEHRSIAPWRVAASVEIDGRKAGVISGRGRSKLRYQSTDLADMEFNSSHDRRLEGNAVGSVLLILIGTLLYTVGAPSRQRLQQHWSISAAGRAIGELKYQRDKLPQYRLSLIAGAEERSLDALAVSLFLARPPSSGGIESHEEIH